MLTRERLEQTGPDPLVARFVNQYVVRREAGEPNEMRAWSPSITDHYDLQPFRLGARTTSPESTLAASYAVVVPLAPPAWESWLRELGRVAAPTTAPPQTMIARQLQEIQRATGLSDAQLASALGGGVARETVNRWRNGSDSVVRPANAHRIGLLLELSRRMSTAGIEARVWLHQAAPVGGATPFALLSAGQLSLVRQIVENIAAGADGTALDTIPRISREPDAVGEDTPEGEVWTWGELETDGERGS